LPAFPEELGLVVLAAAFLRTVFDVFLVDFIYHFFIEPETHNVKKKFDLNQKKEHVG
jgi:hypothetical protein